MIDAGVSSLVAGFPVWPLYVMLGAVAIIAVASIIQMIRAK
nr:hypothetical protein [uncultured Mediterraneibacter sp.]